MRRNRHPPRTARSILMRWADSPGSGNCAFVLFTAEQAAQMLTSHNSRVLKVTRFDETRPSRGFSDYRVTVDRANLPTGIEIQELA